MVKYSVKPTHRIEMDSTTSTGAVVGLFSYPSLSEVAKIFRMLKVPVIFFVFFLVKSHSALAGYSSKLGHCVQSGDVAPPQSHFHCPFGTTGRLPMAMRAKWGMCRRSVWLPRGGGHDQVPQQLLPRRWVQLVHIICGGISLQLLCDLRQHRQYYLGCNRYIFECTLSASSIILSSNILYDRQRCVRGSVSLSSRFLVLYVSTYTNGNLDANETKPRTQRCRSYSTSLPSNFGVPNSA